MTRKDYELVAACIGAALVDSRNDKNTIHDVATRLTLEFKLQNVKFNAGKFFTRVEYWRISHGGDPFGLSPENRELFQEPSDDDPTS